MKTSEALEDSSVITALGITPFQGRRGWQLEELSLQPSSRDGKAILTSPLTAMQGKHTQSAKAGDHRR